MIVCYHLLPNSYLLALASTAAAKAEAELAAHLAQACQSGKSAVWIDCRLLDTLSPTAAWLLWACQQRLQRRRARLVLCRVSDAVKRILHCHLPATGAGMLIVPTLDDAEALA
jgi:hypothetical protein